MQIIGILNITEDSFSDGGKYLDVARARKHAQQLCQAGAHIIDIGAASSHPDAIKVPAEMQIQRLKPLLDGIIAKAQISVDCTLPQVQEFALVSGVGYLNDIRGFPNHDLYPRLAATDTRLIVMHSVSETEIAEHHDVPPERIMGRILQFFDQRVATLMASGIDKQQLILDPGMGFFLGTNPDTSFEVLKGMQTLKSRYSLPILISVSRKSFLRKTVDSDISGVSAATLAAELYAVTQGVDYIRTHDVKQLRDAIRIWQKTV